VTGGSHPEVHSSWRWNGRSQRTAALRSRTKGEGREKAQNRPAPITPGPGPIDPPGSTRPPCLFCAFCAFSRLARNPRGSERFFHLTVQRTAFSISCLRGSGRPSVRGSDHSTLRYRSPHMRVKSRRRQRLSDRLSLAQFRAVRSAVKPSRQDVKTQSDPPSWCLCDLARDPIAFGSNPGFPLTSAGRISS